MANKPFKTYYVLALYSLLLITLFFVQRFFEHHNDQNLLYWCYGFNAFFTIGYLVFIVLLGKTFKHQIGFIFLGFATFKIFAFLGLKYYKNLEIETSQFLIFFLPYFFSIIFEITITKKILDNLSFKDKD